jgi:hypothetical protein
MGFEHHEKTINEIAAEIYSTGAWYSPDKQKIVRFVSFGKEINDSLSAELPQLLQIQLTTIIRFLKDRFCTGCHQTKREYWDKDIIEFAELSIKSSDEELFKWVITK